MVKIDKALLQELRDHTGLGLMDCRKALEETAGDFDQALELLRKKGAAVAAKRADKETGEGLIKAYIHPGDRLGVLLELNCETDFVANTDSVRQFAQDLCLQIAANKAMYVAPENVDQAFLAHEKDIFREQMADSGKPEKIIDQIVEGKVKKLYSDICLLEQAFIKNDQVTVRDVLQELIAKTGESIRIRRFCRFELGK
ncbi:MAG TPA: translation elongation factor Ts [Candidatus Babeliales bacterium]|jgi:elongation factor Ts|nr:translation elongation factor Ts [Candidatus Babeliales bacterium]